MGYSEKIKHWFKKNKNYALIGGTVILSIVGYVIYKNNKISFPEWIKNASKEELDYAYDNMRLNFCETGIKPYGMEQISQELGERGAKEWFEKHPPNLNPNFRWTDANRWEKD